MAFKIRIQAEGGSVCSPTDYPWLEELQARRREEVLWKKNWPSLESRGLLKKEVQIDIFTINY